MTAPRRPRSAVTRSSRPGSRCCARTASRACRCAASPRSSTQGAASLYLYVKNRQDLLNQMFDAVAGEIDLRDQPDPKRWPEAARATRAYAAVVSAGAAAPPPSGAGVSSSGGLAPSLAHGSSNSTRHLPSSFCISASLARNERPLRPLKPVTGFAVRPVRDQLAATAARQRLAGLGLPDHEAAARVLARPARVALAVLDDVVAADRARAEVRARDADVLELRVELADGRAGELRRCRP